MISTRWYILAVAALIAAVYVSTQCRERYVFVEQWDYVIDTWTGKVTHTNGEPVEYEITPCCEGVPVDVMVEPPHAELQSVVPLPTDGLGVPQSQIPEESQTPEIRRKIPGEF